MKHAVERHLKVNLAKKKKKRGKKRAASLPTLM